MAEESKIEVDHKLVLAQKRFLYRTPDLPNVDRPKLQGEILQLVQQHEMAPIYETVTEELGVPADAALLAQLQEANAKRLEELEAKIKDAEENEGEMEVRDALHAKAEYLSGIMDRQAAEAAYKAADGKTVGVGPKMDLAFSQLRLETALGDWAAVRAGVERCKGLVAKGGDWERKNKLKVYEAVLLMATRQFRRAAELLLESIATFTALEVMPYEDVVFYTVVLSVVALDRPTLKAKVVDSPEVLSVVDSIPHLRPFLHALHGCAYADFFKAFAGLSDAVRSDRYLHAHFRFYCREARLVAYSQFLESYKSVSLAAMASAFGVSPDFLDAELAGFIVGGRLPAKIDKVAGVVETNRPDAKNALYQAAIKQGDQLLNRLQKLGRVADLE